MTNDEGLTEEQFRRRCDKRNAVLDRLKIRPHLEQRYWPLAPHPDSDLIVSQEEFDRLIDEVIRLQELDT